MKRFKFVLRASFLILLMCVTLWILYHSRKPTYQGRSMVQWLKILKTNSNPAGEPLKIVHIINRAESDVVTVEVPMSYDLLKKYDFFERNGKLGLMINERGFSTFNARAANGDCLLGFDKNNLNLGTNQIQVEFFIHNSSDRDRPLYAEGPIVEFVITNN
jgi:hypothetical protein